MENHKKAKNYPKVKKNDEEASITYANNQI
jgi:hypothetical protein